MVRGVGRSIDVRGLIIFAYLSQNKGVTYDDERMRENKAEFYSTCFAMHIKQIDTEVPLRNELLYASLML